MAENLFSVLLERLIAEQNIQAERLREGLCTASMMARIRSGERLPNKMMRDRMIARLGVSGERNEHLLNPEDYAQWEKRRDIVKSVQRKETKRAEELLAEYKVEKETFIMNANTGNALKLDSQGTQIWEMVYHGHSKESIKDYFAGLFPDSREAIYRDIENFFSVLERENII